MSFTVRLHQEVLAVEPGSTLPVTVTIENRGTEADRFEFELEGIDPDWKAIPEPVFAVEAGSVRQQMIFLKPARSPESLAGTYPFVVKTRSLESGEIQTVQGVLEVKPFHHLSIEINPKKGYYSPFTKHNDYDVSVVNLGNTEHQIQLTGTDPEDACTYDFGNDQVTLGAGQERSIEFNVQPKGASIVSSGRLIGFSVTGRAVDHPGVVANTQAQLEQRSFFSPTTLGLIAFAALLGGLWWLNLPKAPVVSLKIEPSEVVRGESVTVSWVADGTSRVSLVSDDGTINITDLSASGSRTLPITTKDFINIHAEARRDGMTSKSDAIRIAVREPEVVPVPKIVKFQPDRQRVKLGTSFYLEYDFNDAVTTATLSDGRALDTNLSRLEITPNTPGDITYEVSAMNKAGQSVVKRFTIQVYEESDAAILAFTADKTVAKPDDNVVQLTWQCSSKAVRCELKDSTGKIEVVSAEGSRDMIIGDKTTFTLSAIDDKGRRTTRQLTVNFERPAPPLPDPDNGTAGDPASGGTTGITMPPQTPPPGGNR